MAVGSRVVDTTQNLSRKSGQSGRNFPFCVIFFVFASAATSRDAFPGCLRWFLGKSLPKQNELSTGRPLLPLFPMKFQYLLSNSDDRGQPRQMADFGRNSGILGILGLLSAACGCRKFSRVSNANSSIGNRLMVLITPFLSSYRKWRGMSHILY